MKWFKKKRGQKSAVVNPATDRLSALIVQKTIRFQQRWAAFMQRNTEKLSVGAKKYLLLLFCILASVFSTYLVASSLLSPQSKPFSVSYITMPQAIPAKKSPPVMSEKEYRLIQRYKKYMDSCRLPVRPGLKDSIRRLEAVYEATKK